MRFYILIIINLLGYVDVANVTVALLYPLTDIIELDFTHYASAFTMAVGRINEDFQHSNISLRLIPTVFDTNKRNRARLRQNEKGEAALRIMAENYDSIGAFFGPGLPLCSHQAKFASSFRKPLIAYRCQEATVSDKRNYPTFARMSPPDSYLYKPVIQILKKYSWKRIGIITTTNKESVVAKTLLVNQLKKVSVTIAFEKLFVRMKNYKSFFDDVKISSRIILFIGSNARQRTFLYQAGMHGLHNGEYVVIIIDTGGNYKRSDMYLENIKDHIAWGVNVNRLLTSYRLDNAKLDVMLKMLRHTFLLTQWVKNGLDYSNFQSDVIKNMKTFLGCYNISKASSVECSFRYVPKNAAYLYDAVSLYTNALSTVLQNGGNIKDGVKVMNAAKQTTFKSVTGNDVFVNENLDAEFNLTLLSLQHITVADGKDIIDWAYFGSFLNSDNGSLVLTSLSHIENWELFPPPDVPKCRFDGGKCKTHNTSNSNSDSVVIIISVVFILTISVLAVAFFIYRKKMLIAGTKWKIDSTEIVMPNEYDDEPSMFSMNTVESIIEHQFMTKVALYKGKLVNVKKVENNRLIFNRSALSELHTMLEISHDNINPFLGIVVQTNFNLVIFQYASKGSLQDVLTNDEIPLDTMFSMSFARDIAKGMSYLHRSSLKSHGRLRSSNCLVNSRWVIKITDYGPHFLRSTIPAITETSDEEYFKSLFWTAPELLRLQHSPPEGSQKGDVYSFGIILQEILTNGGPYDMHNIPAEEIISLVKRGTNPPFRPDVKEFRKKSSTASMEHEHQTLFNLMKMCLYEDPVLRPSFPEILKSMMRNKSGRETNVFEQMAKMLERYSNNLEKVIEERTKLLIEEKKKTDDLIYRMLPSFVAEQLKKNNTVTAERYDAATVYFSDIVGFTTIASMSTPMQVVDLLNDLYTLFDSIIKSYDVYKVETIGDAYMVVSGVPLRNGQQHVFEIAEMALNLLKAVEEQFIIRHMLKTKLQIRIGIHSGPVAAGVVGTAMPRYCLFGDTVNKASRMESNGEALKIHISEETKSLLETRACYAITPRDEKINVKNVGTLQTYWLLGKNHVTKHKISNRIHPKNESSPTAVLKTSYLEKARRSIPIFKL